MKMALEGAGFTTQYIWHADASLPKGMDLVVLPGGFAHGDYLRPGAMAARSHIIQDLTKHAGNGLPVFGVCNGFQVLLETGLLPGALRRNIHGRFVCKNVTLKITPNHAPLLAHLVPGTHMTIPVAHHDGCYDIDHDGLRMLQDNGQIIAKYVGENPNGSIDDIAGISSHKGRVVGMMPHPEDHVQPRQGNTDGARLFQSFYQTLAGAA